ncbi:hypothetical protein CDAR_127361 [Caerostris darwini]|uniref:Uncharacterized protein n=1 Tax=Caerostris darwini TaxID=1538125 RepID=A0AAV4SN39_9ARAC|nr:hypothetical protein CDAR_127361 [Caerostris darwini]
MVAIRFSKEPTVRGAFHGNSKYPLPEMETPSAFSGDYYRASALSSAEVDPEGIECLFRKNIFSGATMKF